MYDVVGRRGARGQADRDRPLGQPGRARGLVVAAHGPVADRLALDAVGGADVVRRQPLGADASERLGVAAVVAADHDHQVEAALGEHLLHGVLAVLGRRADRVEGAEARVELGLAPARAHRGTQQLLDLEALRHQHRRLVGEPDLLQIALGVEAGAGRRGEALDERLGADRAADEAAHELGLGAVLDAQELPARVGERLRRGRLGLLVVVLAVDHRGEAVARVAVHVLPDVEHAAAGGVDEHAALCAQVLHLGHRDAERRQDHDVRLLDAGVALFGGVFVVGDPDPERLDPPVDLRVVDDLAREEDAAVRELLARFVGVLDRAVDAVAEAELAGELDPDLAGPRRVAQLLEPLHDLRVIALGEHRAHDGLEVEALLEVGLPAAAHP